MFFFRRCHVNIIQQVTFQMDINKTANEYQQEKYDVKRARMETEWSINRSESERIMADEQRTPSDSDGGNRSVVHDTQLSVGEERLNRLGY